MDSTSFPDESDKLSGAISKTRAIESFTPKRVHSLLTEIGGEVSSACHALRNTDARVDLDEVYNTLCNLIPYSTFQPNIANECEFRLDEAIANSSLDNRKAFLRLYGIHLAQGTLPLPKPKVCARVMDAIDTLAPDEESLAVRIAKRSESRKKTGLDVLVGSPRAFERCPIEKPQYPLFEHKWKYFDDRIEIEFWRCGQAANTIRIPKMASEVLRNELANGELLILDNDFLLRRFNVDGLEMARTVVPNHFGFPTSHSFRYERGRCLECSKDCSRVYVSDMAYLFEFDGSLKLTNTFEFHHLAYTKSWDNVFFSMRFKSHDPPSSKEVQPELNLLGLPEIPKSRDMLRTAFRAKLLECHPDLNPFLADAHERTIELNAALEVVSNRMTGGPLDELLDEIVIERSGASERIQTVTVTSDACMVGTYKGGIFRIVGGKWDLIEQANFWLHTIDAGCGHRAYRSVFSTIVVPSCSPPWEIPQTYSVVQFSESKFALADGKAVRLYDISGRKLAEVLCPNSVLDIEFQSDRCVLVTTNDRFHCLYDLLESDRSHDLSKSFLPTGTLNLKVEHIRKAHKLSKIHSRIYDAVYHNKKLSDRAIQKLIDQEGVDATDSEGMTPLHQLASMGTYANHAEVALRLSLFLIKAGANVNAQVDSWTANENRYPDGRTALHMAIDAVMVGSESAAVSIIRMLLDNGIDPNLPDFKGVPPMRMVVNRNLILIAELLLQNGADPMTVDKRGASLLSKAKARKLDHMVELLLRHGSR